MSLERARAEEKELEELMYGTEADHKETQEDLKTVEEFKDTPFEEPADATVEEEDEESEDNEDTDEPEKKKRSSWKQRYSTYKATTDSTIYRLRQEVAELKGHNVTLVKKIDKLQELYSQSTPEDMFKGIVTQEDEELIGSEAVDVMKRVTKAAQEPLLNQIKQLKKEKLEKDQRDADNAQSISRSELRLKLSKMVNNFDAVDTSPGFAKFLGEVDDYSGRTRKELYSLAVTNGDVRRVADFYKDYISNLPATKESILERKVAPVGSGGSNQNGTPVKQQYTLDEYLSTYDAYNKGKYRNAKEKKALQDKMNILDEAYSQGRIVE